jgi:hypothetical protein
MVQLFVRGAVLIKKAQKLDKQNQAKNSFHDKNNYQIMQKPKNDL